MLYLQILDSLGKQTIGILKEADGFMHHFTAVATQYIPRLILGLLWLYLGFKLVNRIVGFINGNLSKSQMDKDLRPFMVGFMRVFFKAVVAVSAAGIMGFETSSFVAILAATGFAVGLAFQGSLSNFAGGILILLFKPFRTGDLITSGEHTGRVREIQLLYTVLETLSHRRVIIPNSILSNGVVENITGAGIIRVDLTFSIDYNSDIDKARSVLMQVIGTCPFAVNETKYKHEVCVKSLGNSAVELVAWVWANGDDYWHTYFFMQENVKKAFDANGIEIPFDQMDVHINNGH